MSSERRLRDLLVTTRPIWFKVKNGHHDRPRVRSSEASEACSSGPGEPVEMCLLDRRRSHLAKIAMDNHWLRATTMMRSKSFGRLLNSQSDSSVASEPASVGRDFSLMEAPLP